MGKIEVYKWISRFQKDEMSIDGNLVLEIDRRPERKWWQSLCSCTNDVDQRWTIEVIAEASDRFVANEELVFLSWRCKYSFRFLSVRQVLVKIAWILAPYSPKICSVWPFFSFILFYFFPRMKNVTYTLIDFTRGLFKRNLNQTKINQWIWSFKSNMGLTGKIFP